MPTRSPTFTGLDSEPGPSLWIIPMPSWPPICPASVGKGTTEG